MNLNKLFDIQAKLDERIVQEHSLQGQDLLDKKILALQVELGELANEWRGFKFWSKDQEPRKEIVCGTCDGTGGHMEYIEAPMIEHTLVACEDCNETGIYGYPLLEEYVDCLHFILSIGLELEMDKKDLSIGRIRNDDQVVCLFNEVFSDTVELGFSALFGTKKQLKFESLFNTFISLGEQLGFIWEQIEQAYMDKNKINHARQDTGY